MVDPHVLGLHHVTAIARDAQTNLDFYTGVLGLRLVKLTVNFDDPTSYHLYYGDATGRPGSILTFFAYDGRPGALGLGQATATAFSIPPNTLEFWTDRLSGHGISTRPVPSRLGETGLALADPDGMRLELIEHDEPGAGGEWIGQIVETAKAITGLHSVTIPTASEATGRFLDEVFGWDERTVDASTKRFHGEKSGAVDLVEAAYSAHGRVAIGSVHHVAFRVRNEDAQAHWRQRLVERGYSVSAFMDRDYFRSIYFHEPGGVLFEIATDTPGFATDEAVDRLGTSLMLPKRLEPGRELIGRALPTLDLPSLVH